MIIIPTEKRFDWKHTPITLFCIVLINVIVFFFYQSDDDHQRFFYSVEGYQNFNMLEREWPIFKDYLTSTGEMDQLGEYQQQYNKKDFDSLVISILMCKDFNVYLEDKLRTLLEAESGDKKEQLEQHLIFRLMFIKALEPVSLIKLGVFPNRLEPFSLIAHQFLHGNLSHLLGNMFILVICGFAVEAVVGHLNFLLFYLISGGVAALAQASIDLSSFIPLIGASGALSGIMAMYLGVFRFKKIEFFYWFFIFVGYVRLPALLLLPFYIGKELVFYYIYADSGVGFMAHAGGFIAGGILLGASFLIKPEILNQEYIEEDQSIDPLQQKLQYVYGDIDRYRFDSALSGLKDIIDQYGLTFERAVLRYNLIKISHPKKYSTVVIKLFKMTPPSENDLRKFKQIWLKNIPEQSLLDDESSIKVALNFSTMEHITTAEDIFNRLNDKACKLQSLEFLALKIAHIHEQLNNSAKRSEYKQWAETLSQGNI